MPKISRLGGPTYLKDEQAVAEPVSAPEAAPAEDEVLEIELDDEEDGPEYGAWLIVDLKDECSRRGLPRSGNKDELVARLLAADDAGI